MEISIEELVSFRKELHRFPEVSGEEEGTAERVLEFLEACKPDRIMTKVGGHGVVALFEGLNEGPTIVIRCELDALPIQEVNDFYYKSAVDGKSHKCGHDGHMAIVAGLAQHFSHARPEKGNVALLFQPAEENGDGAVAVLQDDRFLELNPDYVVALHNLPGYDTHKIICRTGTFTAAVNSIIIQLDGKTAHAGEPEMGINPAGAISDIVAAYDDLVHNVLDEDFTLITPILIEMGKEALGISAGSGRMIFTIRTWDTQSLRELENKCAEIALEVGDKYGLNTRISWDQFFAANQNHDEVVAAINEVARTCALSYEQRDSPFKFGEDFGLFTEKYKGAMFGLGSGISCPALHNPDYDFPDEIIPTGIQMFRGVIEKLLNE